MEVLIPEPQNMILFGHSFFKKKKQDHNNGSCSITTVLTRGTQDIGANRKMTTRTKHASTCQEKKYQKKQNPWTP